MKRYLLLLLSAITIGYASADDIKHGDDHNISYVKNNKRVPDQEYQRSLRQRSNWQNFLNTNGNWWVEFDERTELPRRAMGKPIAVTGSSWQNKAIGFINTALADFDIPVSEMKLTGTSQSDNYNWVRFEQVHDGYRVFDSEMMVKMTNSDKAVMFGMRVYSDISYAAPTISATQAESSAQSGIIGQITNVTTASDFMILPVEEGYDGEREKLFYHLVYNVMVEGTNNDNIPFRYFTLVDAVSGKLWYRANEVMHSGGKPGKSKKAAGVIEMDMEANLYTTHSFNPATIESLANLEIVINGNTFYTDNNGFVTTTESGPATATIPLRGRWSTVYTNNVTPSLSAAVVDGTNLVDYTGSATIQELSAYYHVDYIHEHMKFWLPSFTGLDFSMATNVDLTTGDCNAFYNGFSVNFYAAAAGCTSFATCSDIVYHEYGHGINDYYYSSLGGSFINGGTNEGYADFWALSITLNPLLAQGHDASNVNEIIRRYDIDPKVYPDDLVGQVHADGEIICGAWWDTHLNLGSNMSTTMELFVDAYNGLQATLSNGNEGEVFTNILIDVLQADDVPANGGDNDITNGTPNGQAIADAFALHGITLISNADLFHADVKSAPASAPIYIDADLTLTFPYTQYLGDLSVVYRVNGNTTWNTIPMNAVAGSSYDAEIPAQPIGTLITYYIASEDVNGNISSVEPIGAAAASHPNTPYFILVGFAMVGEDDVADFTQDFGNWTVGLPNDNATTGEWVLAVPIGSFSTPGDASTIVQTDEDHTVNPGDICYITGNANTIFDGIGTNDVDGGSTNLVSPVFDLTINQNPTFSYWKWYTNNPPTGANPKADWWQVFITNDGGSSWVPVENTLTGERNWRRYAFRVQDYVTPTSNVQLKFTVSDSIHLGQNLDGGSLVEAALDDIRLWDNENFWSVDEVSVFAEMSVTPNPAVSEFKLDFTTTRQDDIRIVIYDASGRNVYNKELGTMGAGEYTMRLSPDLAPGYYNVRLIGLSTGKTVKIQVVD